MSATLMVRALASLGLLACARGVLPAQGSPSRDMIPKELALALVSYGRDGGDFLVGGLPGDLAADLPIPAGGRVIGSFASPDVSTSVLTLPVTPDSARMLVTRTLQEHGWRVHQPVGRRGGLTVPASSLMRMLCKPGRADQIAVTTQPGANGTSPGTIVRLMRTPAGPACDETGVGAVEPGRRMTDPFSTLPPLYAPEESTPGQACRPGSYGGMASQTIPVHSSMSAAVLLAHYGRQLDSAGWKPLAADSASAIGHWSKSVGAREPQVVTVTVTPMPGGAGCYSVTLGATHVP